MTEKEKGSSNRPKPKGNITEEERDKRVLAVFDMIMDDVPTAEILEWIMSEYKVKRVQAYTYLKHARNLRIGVAQNIAKGKYEAQKEMVLSELWQLYESEATTTKNKMDILVNFDKIAKGSVDIKDQKSDKWTTDYTKDNLLALVQTGKVDEEKK